jgi:hypothetical protein
VFRQVGFSPAARIRETYELSRAKRADVVLKVETLDARGEKAEYWLKIGRPRTLDTQGGPVQVRFGQFKPGLAGAPEREPKKP